MTSLPESVVAGGLTCEEVLERLVDLTPTSVTGVTP